MRFMTWTSMLAIPACCAPALTTADSSQIERWIGPEAPQCVSVTELKSSASLIELTSDQFQFARALFVAIPPVSHALPPGDRAVMVSADGLVMVALVADGQACARFLAPPFVQDMLMKVGQGETPKLGEAL